MAWRNGPASWGLVSRALHWTMALGLLGMVPFGLWLARTPPRMDTLWLYGLHKSLGLTLLALALVRIGWHVLSRPPALLAAGVPRWQLRLARATHLGLYALMLAAPVAGWVASSATGIDTLLFGHWRVPALAPPSERLDLWGFRAHLALALGLVALAALHAAGALRRHLVHRDATLRRMLRGR